MKMTEALKIYWIDLINENLFTGKFCQRNGNFNEFCIFFDTFKPYFRRLADEHPIIYIYIHVQ